MYSKPDACFSSLFIYFLLLLLWFFVCLFWGSFFLSQFNKSFRLTQLYKRHEIFVSEPHKTYDLKQFNQVESINSMSL